MKPETDELIPTRWTLIERLKDWDDGESWRMFFDTYWKLIYGVAMKSGLSHAEAQDVVQETVVSVSKSIKGFRADPALGSFKSWLLNLTRWRITDQVRKRGREVQPLRHPDSTATGTPAEARIPDPAPGQLDQIWEEEWERHMIEAALERVKKHADARHYQIFFLVAIKQVPPEKVAATFGIKTDQVYLVKHRLTKVFEAALQAVETHTE